MKKAIVIVVALAGVLAQGGVVVKTARVGGLKSSAKVVTNVTYTAEARPTTNDVNNLIEGKVTKSYVEGLGIGGGVDTNAVLALVASPTVTNAGAVAAAAAAVTAAGYRPMTNRVWSAGSYGDWTGEAIDILEERYAPNTPVYNCGYQGILGGYVWEMTFDGTGFFIFKNSSYGVWQSYEEANKSLSGYMDNDYSSGPVSRTYTSPANLALDTETAAAIAAATNGVATRAEVAAVSNTVATWEGYWRGEIVRISVTNYYGNTSGEPPRLRIEEAETNSTGEITGYKIVWDEVTRQTNYQAQISAQVAATSNAVMTAAYRQTYNQLGNKAPRAWGEVTSAGEAAPANTVWITEPKLVIAGGTEYAHFAVGQGTISVLAANGQTPYTAGAAGQFRFCDEGGSNYFGFDVKSAYTIGCRTDGISVDQTTHIVTLTYDLTSDNAPTIYHSTNLTEWAAAEATWEQNPPTGQQVCYLNAGTSPCGYYKATISSAGGAKFLTNMQADLMGGIAATNEVDNVIQSVYPVITSTGVVWRVKQ